MAVASLGIVSDRGLVTGSWEWVPHGCSVWYQRVGDTATHFNTKARADANNDGHYTAVCYSGTGYGFSFLKRPKSPSKSGPLFSPMSIWILGLYLDWCGKKATLKIRV